MRNFPRRGNPARHRRPGRALLSFQRILFPRTRMRRLKPLLLLALLVAAVAMWQQHTSAPAVGGSTITQVDRSSAPDQGQRTTAADFLPPEAHDTLALIARGGPYPHRQDDGVFGNYEGLLPKQSRGYYHEYTVETPGAGHRGARRIITGGTPPTVYYYTADHYRSFHRFEVNR